MSQQPRLRDFGFGEGNLVRRYLDEASKTPLLTESGERTLLETIRHDRETLAEFALRIPSGLQTFLLPQGPATGPEKGWEWPLLEVDRFHQRLLILRTWDHRLQPKTAPQRYRWARSFSVQKQDLDERCSHLVRANLLMVVRIAKRYARYELKFLDLIQAGNTGLVRSVDKFDCTKPNRFMTYAVWWVRQSMTRALTDEGRTIRMPGYARKKLYRLRDAGVDSRALDALEQAEQRILSLEDDDPETQALIHVVPDIRAVKPDLSIQNRETRELLRHSLETLDEREKRVISRRFDLDGRGGATLKKIGQEMGLSRERIRQIEELVLLKLRRALRRKEGRVFKSPP